MQGRLAVFLDGEFYLNRMRTVEILQELQRSGDIPPVTVLFVSHATAMTRQVEYICNPACHRFLVEELLPWAEGQGYGSGTDHLLAGLSLSGLAAVYAGIWHPGVFSRVLGQSPSAWWKDEWLAGQVAGRSQSWPRFWLSVGSRETDENVQHMALFQGTSQLATCRNLATALQERGAVCQLTEFDGGHEMPCWEAELPSALRWLYADLT